MHVTGLFPAEAETFAAASDLLTSCASETIRETAGRKALLQGRRRGTDLRHDPESQRPDPREGPAGQRPGAGQDHGTAAALRAPAGTARVSNGISPGVFPVYPPVSPDPVNFLVRFRRPAFFCRLPEGSKNPGAGIPGFMEHPVTAAFAPAPCAPRSAGATLHSTGPSAREDRCAFRSRRFSPAP